MDLATFVAITVVLAIISLMTGIVVGVVGYFRKEKMLMKVFPYIKKSGDDITIFDFIIHERYIKAHFYYVILVVTLIIFIVLFNAFFSITSKYNPYDGLDCFALYNNGSIIEVVSEEQAKMETVTRVTCIGWNLDIATGIGHAAAILTLSWILVSIMLWIKLKLYYKRLTCCDCSDKRELVALITFHLLFTLCIIVTTFLLIIFVATYNLPLTEVLDILLISVNLFSGLTVFPSHKKRKTLAKHCKEAVEDRQGEEEGALVPIKDRLRRVQNHQIQVDHQVDRLEELAELECKKVLEEDKKEREWDIVNEDEMRKIVQVAYRKVAPDDEREQSSEQTSTDEIQQEVRNGNNGSERGRTEDQGAIEQPNTATERDGLLGNARRNKTSCQLM